MVHSEVAAEVDLLTDETYFVYVDVVNSEGCVPRLQRFAPIKVDTRVDAPSKLTTGVFFPIQVIV